MGSNGRKLPSGKIVNANWKPVKSAFYAVMTRMKPYRDYVPDKMKVVLEKDWKALEKALKAEVKEPKKAEE